MPAGGHQAAPDRPRDLHPLQHLRGDLPGRRDHARRRATTSSAPTICNGCMAVHLAVPDRVDRQLAQRAEGDAPMRSTSSSRGTSCRRADRALEAEASPRPEVAAERRSRAITTEGGERRSTGRVPSRCRRGRPRTLRQPVHAREGPATATVVGNFALHRGRTARADIHHIVLDFGATAVPGARRPDRSASSRREPTRSGRPHVRAPVLGREPARRRASAATTTSR